MLFLIQVTIFFDYMLDFVEAQLLVNDLIVFANQDKYRKENECETILDA